MKIDVEAWVQRGGDGKLLRDTKGVFTYAAIDDKGRPHPVHRV
jgi:acyl-CoA hydrolase